MVLPGALWFLLLRYIPMIGILLGFKEYTVASGTNVNFLNNLIQSKWVGFRNFESIFASNKSFIAVRNTLLYNIVFIILGLVISVAFAIMLSELTKKFLAKVYQTLMFFPYFLSFVVVAYFVFAFFDPTNGLITAYRASHGMSKIDWYNTPKPWPIILVIVNLWKNVGYNTILYLAAITGFDRSQYEAASIDGASKWQQIRYITLPNLRPMICILLIMAVGKIFNADFGLFYQVPMNAQQTYTTTRVVDTYIYELFNTTRSIGQSTAGGLIQNAVGFVAIMIANKVVTKIDEDSALF
jgi:putative aldouronate transport system permease protein